MIIKSFKIWQKLFGYKIGDEIEFYNLQTEEWEEGIITNIFPSYSPNRYWIREKESGLIYAVFETEIR